MPLKSVTIYHNPKCGNSRGALEILRGRGIEPTIVEYLKSPLTEDELRQLAKKAGLSARDMIRAKEDVFKELKLDGASEDKLFKAMAAHPILMNRPIVDIGARAKLCRPPETIEELLS